VTACQDEQSWGSRPYGPTLTWLVLFAIRCCSLTHMLGIYGPSIERNTTTRFRAVDQRNVVEKSGNRNTLLFRRQSDGNARVPTHPLPSTTGCFLVVAGAGRGVATLPSRRPRRGLDVFTALSSDKKKRPLLVFSVLLRPGGAVAGPFRPATVCGLYEATEPPARAGPTQVRGRLRRTVLQAACRQWRAPLPDPRGPTARPGPARATIPLSGASPPMPSSSPRPGRASKMFQAPVFGVHNDGEFWHAGPAMSDSRSGPRMESSTGPRPAPDRRKCQRRCRNVKSAQGPAFSPPIHRHRGGSGGKTRNHDLFASWCPVGQNHRQISPRAYATTQFHLRSVTEMIHAANNSGLLRVTLLPGGQRIWSVFAPNPAPANFAMQLQRASLGCPPTDVS